jgi:hypothetical protein
MENKFLKAFIARQMTFVHDAPKEERKKPKHGTADGRPPFGGDDGCKAMMVELLKEKQPKKKVLEYFRERIKELLKEDEKKF